MKVVVLTKYPLKGSMKEMVRSAIPDDIDVIFVGCDPRDRAMDASFTRPLMKYMKADFKEYVTQENPDVVLALGNEGLYVSTGHSGIMKYRGKELAAEGITIIPSIAPAAADRNPSQKPLLEADIRAAVRKVKGEVIDIMPPKVLVVNTIRRIKDLLAVLSTASVVAFDVETDSFDELREGAFIVSLALTIRTDFGGGAGQEDSCWAIPLRHRASPWLKDEKWKVVLKKISAACAKVPVRVAHNAKFDSRWLVQFDAPIPANWDTMLAAHLLNENRRKGLKVLARILLGAPEWDIPLNFGKKAEPWYHQHPLPKILKYNALDTWYTLKLYDVFSAELCSDDRLLAIFEKLMMPASQSFVHIERHGIYCDRKDLEKAAIVVQDKLDAIHARLMDYVDPEAIPEGMKVNWNPSGFLRWFLFTYLELPVMRETKSGPSTAEDVMSRLAKDYEVPALLAERVSWNKMNTSFIAPYKRLLDKDSRLHTTFRVDGTVTGRTSSGKPDADKATGSGNNLIGINLQQVPRDPLIRNLFGAPEGYAFIEADYSQIELRIAAEVARERVMLGLYARGEDIHMTMAMRLTGKPANRVTKSERTKAKSVNFGFLYGMGPNKFVETAWNDYGIEVSVDEARAFRKAFFQQFPDLQRWHAQQRRLVHKYGRIQSLFGRIRHLPDINSFDETVISEAERQAINSPVQATGSDLCLLSMVLLDRQFRKKGLKARPIGTVHDSILFECPNRELKTVVPLVRSVMENPPTERLFGYGLRVPLVADISVGQRWGLGRAV